MEITTERDIINDNELMEKLPARERIAWAVEHFGNSLVMSTSFGIQSAVLLHMASNVYREIPVIFIDTGYHFKETYQFAEALQKRLHFNLKVYQPLMTAARQEALYGKRWEQGEEALREYNLQNKVEPMNRALKELGARAWMSGLRWAQADTRQDVRYMELQNKTYKLHPIVDWSDRDIYRYLQEHDLPYHPLWEEGYVSIGDWHSTRRLTDGMRPEETRFHGIKRECGLHEESGNLDYQI